MRYNDFRKGGKVMEKFIDLTPTWTAVMPVLLDIIENGNDEAKKIAREELLDLAKKVDDVNTKAKECKKLLQNK